MEWPDINEETGAFDTTQTNKQVWKRTVDAALSDFTEDQTVLKPKIDAFKVRLMNCENWALEYRSILEDFTAIMAAASNEQCLDMAQAGLDALHGMMLFRIDHQTIVPAKDIFMLSGSFAKLETVTLLGTKAPDIDFQFPLVNPQNLEDENELYGVDACAQVDAWYKYGVLETSASVLAKTTLISNNITSTLHNKVFVLLGCTSEMGPAKSLLQIPGVTVIGVARGGRRLDDMIDFVRFHSPDDTTFMYPKNGADLIHQGPQITQWILDHTDPKQQIILCPLASMDGEASVRVTVAQDLIVQRILRQRSNTVLSQYISPATVLVLPPAAATNAERRFNDRPKWEKWAGTLSMGKWLQPSLPKSETSNNDYCILNGLVGVQGPDYALAKTMQMWRCMLAMYREDHIVSAPFAPTTRTRSMMENSQVAAALEGMHQFEPLLAFDVGPASSLLAAILVSHIQMLNRPLPDMEENPFTLFWDGAVHGGVWTCPYSLDSISTINWVLGKTTYYPPGYIPEGALPKIKAAAGEEGEEPSSEPKSDMFDLTDSQYGKPMPDCVRERLEFM
jgi:hypothetical protein